NRVVVDAGQKSLTLFTNFFNPQPPPPHYGYIVEYPEAKMRGMFVEHGIVDVSACKHKFKVGERLSVIPVHQEMTLNLHDELVGVRGGKVEVIWPVAARGKTR
ncbi:MAG: D-TA family PLP-dependent enzyme, partial [Candidatus Bathyarchaeia archaeon]